MFVLDKTTLYWYIMIFIILVYMVSSSNHINTLVLFFLNVLICYIYSYLINCNWVRLILILWYARRITVLFYLLSCYSSSSNYFNIYPSKKVKIFLFASSKYKNSNKSWYMHIYTICKNKITLLAKKAKKRFDLYEYRFEVYRGRRRKAKRARLNAKKYKKKPLITKIKNILRFFFILFCLIFCVGIVIWFTYLPFSSIQRYFHLFNLISTSTDPLVNYGIIKDRFYSDLTLIYYKAGMGTLFYKLSKVSFLNLFVSTIYVYYTNVTTIMITIYNFISVIIGKICYFYGLFARIFPWNQWKTSTVNEENHDQIISILGKNQLRQEFEEVLDSWVREIPFDTTITYPFLEGFNFKDLGLVYLSYYGEPLSNSKSFVDEFLITVNDDYPVTYPPIDNIICHGENNLITKAAKLCMDVIDSIFKNNTEEEIVNLTMPMYSYEDGILVSKFKFKLPDNLILIDNNPTNNILTPELNFDLPLSFFNDDFFYEIIYSNPLCFEDLSDKMNKFCEELFTQPLIIKEPFFSYFNDNFTTNESNIIYYTKDVSFQYSDFTHIYASIASTPSSIFLLLFFMPVFLYVIYFICNILSFRNKKK